MGGATRVSFDYMTMSFKRHQDVEVFVGGLPQEATTEVEPNFSDGWELTRHG